MLTLACAPVLRLVIAVRRQVVSKNTSVLELASVLRLGVGHAVTMDVYARRGSAAVTGVTKNVDQDNAGNVAMMTTVHVGGGVGGSKDVVAT